MRRCKRCAISLPITQFAQRQRSPDGYSTWCRICVKEYGKLWRKTNVRKAKRAALKFHYNLDLETYESLEKKCSICGCGPETRKIFVDHCHKTKAVRGLLCQRCNTSVGYFEDNPDLLRRAIQYLEDKTQWISQED